MAEHQTTETTTTHTETTSEHGNTHTHADQKKSTLLSDILSIIGFAILFIIIIWGLIHLVSLSSNWFSSLFNHPAPSIQVSAPASVTSGNEMTVSWKYTPTISGTYAFLYQCQNGLSFETRSASSTYQTVPCGAAYTAPTSNNTLELLPILTGSTSVGDTITIIYFPSQASSSQVHGNATTTINPAPAPVPAKSTTTTSSSGSGSTYTTKKSTGSGQVIYAGPADLSVRIVSEYVDGSGAGVVSFDIANIGGSPSGSYYFTADLPTAQPYPYVSPEQLSLAPGSHIVNTLRFTDVASGGGIFSVTVQSGDSNPGNNTASVQVIAPYNNLPSGQAGYNAYSPAPYTVYPTYTY